MLYLGFTTLRSRMRNEMKPRNLKMWLAIIEALETWEPEA